MGPKVSMRSNLGGIPSPAGGTVVLIQSSCTPPNAVLTIAGSNQPFVVGAVPGPVSLTDLDEVTIFDPDQYNLTLPDGRVLQISYPWLKDPTFGASMMVEPWGARFTVV
jgi:hypothetical protein